MYAAPPPHAYHRNRCEHDQDPPPFYQPALGLRRYPLPGTILGCTHGTPTQDGGGVIQVVRGDQPATVSAAGASMAVPPTIRSRVKSYVASLLFLPLY